MPLRRLRLAAAVGGLSMVVASAVQAEPAPRGPLFVMPLSTASSDPRVRWLGEGVALVVADGLEALGVDVAGRETRDRAFADLGLPPARLLSRATRVTVSRLSGVTTLVEGHVSVEGETLTVTARVLDLAAARFGLPVTERGSAGDLYDVGLMVASRLSVQLGAPAVPATLRLDRPPLDAFQAYVQALEAVGHAERVRLLELAIQRSPSFDRAQLALADAHAEVGDSERALAAARGVPASSPRTRAARFREAGALIDLERYDAAFTLLQTQAAEQPSAAVFNNLGVIQLRRGWTPETGQPSFYFTKAAEADAEDVDVLFNLGYAYWIERNPAAAVYWLREAVRRGPADADTHAVLAAALAATGAAVESTRERELAARLAARYEQADWTVREGDANHPLAGLERTLGPGDESVRRVSNPAEAVAAADRLTLSRFHLERAQRAFEAGDDAEAIAQLRRVVHLMPYDAPAQLLLGRSYLRSGRAREAIGACRLSLWSEASAPAHACLAAALLAMHDVEGARAEARRALALDPADAAAQAVLARIGDASPR